jgi:hypothetical protein
MEVAVHSMLKTDYLRLMVMGREERGEAIEVRRQALSILIYKEQ